MRNTWVPTAPYAPLLVLADLVSDYAADCGAADCSEAAAAAKYGPGNAAYGGTGDGALVTRGHIGTGAQAKQYGRYPGDHGGFLD
jgi:hypothetical protein